MFFNFYKKQNSGDEKCSLDPFDELKKHFGELFASPESKIGFAFPGSHSSRHGRGDEEDGSEKDAKDFTEKIKKFSMKPREIRDFLDRFVVKQAEAKKVLAVAICDHYNHVRRCLIKGDEEEYNKQNVLLLGPTGVGKTYLIKNIAKLIGVPFVKVDATKFSETGYVGSDVDEMIRDLVKVADGNIGVAQYGIVFIDEIDKVATSTEFGGRDISGRGVQINLLKLMEESEIGAYSQADMVSQLRAAMNFASGKIETKRSINTKHILFIASGAFDKLSDIVKTRIGNKSIGFGFKASENEEEETYELLQNVSTADFIQYGFEPEFIGRLPVRVACESLNAEDLKNVLLSSEGSILKQYVNDFRGYGIKFTMDDDATTEIAKAASEEKTGARGLLTILEKLLRDFKFELPSMKVKSVRITKDAVMNTKKALAEIIAKAASVTNVADGASAADGGKIAGGTKGIDEAKSAGGTKTAGGAKASDGGKIGGVTRLNAKKSLPKENESNSGKIA